MMTKKDFVALAEALNRTMPYVLPGHQEAEYYVWSQVVRVIRDVCAASNPRFESDRFYLACGGAGMDIIRDHRLEAADPRFVRKEEKMIKIYEEKAVPTLRMMSAELKAMSDADVIEMYIRDQRSAALCYYRSRLGRALSHAVDFRKEGQELELPDGTTVVFVA